MIPRLILLITLALSVSLPLQAQIQKVNLIFPPDSLIRFAEKIFAAPLPMSKDTGQYTFYSKIKDTSTKALLPATGGCTDNIMVKPLRIMDIDRKELYFILSSRTATWDDSCDFLSGNEIYGSFFALPSDSLSKLVCIPEIGADININFGEIIAATFFTGTDIYYFNFECMRRQKRYYYRKLRSVNNLIVEEKTGEPVK